MLFLIEMLISLLTRVKSIESWTDVFQEEHYSSDESLPHLYSNEIAICYKEIELMKVKFCGGPCQEKKTIWKISFFSASEKNDNFYVTLP